MNVDLQIPESIWQQADGEGGSEAGRVRARGRLLCEQLLHDTVVPGILVQHTYDPGYERFQQARCYRIRG